MTAPIKKRNTKSRGGQTSRRQSVYAAFDTKTCCPTAVGLFLLVLTSKITKAEEENIRGNN